MFKKNEFACEQKFARIIQTTENPSYKRRLKELGLFNLAKRRLKGTEYFSASSSGRQDYFQAGSSGLALPEIQERARTETNPCEISGLAMFDTNQPTSLAFFFGDIGGFCYSFYSLTVLNAHVNP